MKYLLTLNKWFWKYRYRLFLGVVFVALANYFGVLQPRMVRFALDEVVANMRIYPLLRDTALAPSFLKTISYQLGSFGLLVIVFALTMGVFMFFMRWTLIVMSRHIEYDIRKEIYDHLQALDATFYKESTTGDLMSRISEDVNKVRMYLGPAILYGINLLILFILVIQSMISVNAKLTLYALAPLPILSVVIYIVSEKINKKSGAIQQQLSRLTSIAQEVYSGIRVIKSYVQEKAMVRFFSNESEVYLKKSMSLARTDALFFPFMILMIGVSTIVTIYVGGLFVYQGHITPGNIGEFVIYVNMLTWPVTAIGWVASIIQQAAASQRRINELLDRSSALRDGDQLPASEGEGLQFHNVSFTYAHTGIQAVRDISFSVRPGEKVAIVGRTGSGKSTVAELSMRMFDVSNGQITWHGLPITSFKLTSYRKAIGYVPQDVFLFSDTVAANISFGADVYNTDMIHAVAQQAGILDEIMRLPDKMQTIVGERGVTLSGGQKQRISIARALLKNPQLLILDDALSAVDTDTAHSILSDIEKMNGTGLLLITHRLTGLGDFNLILVMEEGKIIDRGTHESLIQKKGLYAELYEQQRLEES